MRLLDSVDELDFRDYLRPGDRLVWGQACGEPRTLVEHLLSGPLPRGLSAFVGIDVANTIRVEQAARVRLTSYIGSGGNSALHTAGLLDITPQHYSALPHFVTAPDTGADVVLLRIPPPDPHRRVSLGTNHDYLADALRHARVVIAEIDERAPYTEGDADLTTADIDVAVPARLPAAEAVSVAPDPVQRRVAAHVADLVDDGATLQVGVGSLTDTVLSQLTNRRHLGLHSGQIPDPVADLMLRGVLTGERKTLDRGLAVAGMLLGTQHLFDFAHRNPRISLRRAGYTHAHDVLAQQPKLTAINSALEVDLTGQINSEVARGRYVGAVGGAVDFLRGAAASPGGVPIVMLPATAGAASRIVASLSGPVSVPRSDAAVIVTEHGHADLRGLTLGQRAHALIAIAAPEHRDLLSHAAAMTVQTGAADVVLAGGVESMSRIEHYTTDVRWGRRSGGTMLHDRLDRGRERAQPEWRHGYLSGMVETAENVAAKYSITREQADAFAASSHAKAAAAWSSGRFAKEVVPVEVPGERGAGSSVFDRDEGIRPETTPDTLARLKPVVAGGTVTAGNASQQNDAAAACLVVAEDKLEELGLQPAGFLVGWSAVGCDPATMGLGPVPAVAKLLDRTGLSFDDLALVELNEAFASQVLGVLQGWGWNDLDRLNVNGSGISLGHPIGATGARMMVTLLHELGRRGGGLGLETMCIGGGPGMAAVFDVPAAATT